MFLRRVLCPLNVLSMAGDIKENEMTPVSSVDYVRGLKGKDSVLIKPGDLPHPNTGGEFIAGNGLINNKWYRIAIGRDGSYPCSGIFNIGNIFKNNSPRIILFYSLAEGYGNASFIAKLASSLVPPVSKVRVLFGKSPLVSYLDIYVSTNLENDFYISASCLMNFQLQTPEEVSETIPEGYSVKEVSF